MKKLISIILCIVLCCSTLASCRNRNADGGNSDTLKVAVLESAYGSEMWEKVCDEFEKTVGDVNVQLTADKNIEDVIDLKFKIKELYNNMKKVLEDREKKIIEMRFGLNGEKIKTQREIAKILNISRSYVSRIETRAINKLSKEIKE